MLNRTHFVITLFFVLIILPIINNKFIFASVALIATLLPDIDTRFSYFGKYKILRPLQFFSRHRGIFHSLIFLFFILIIFSIFIPVFVFPFFLGYGFHLISDSFTLQGIKPFWPLKFVSKGPVKTGGNIDKTIFYVFVIIDVVLAGSILYSFI